MAPWLVLIGAFRSSRWLSLIGGFRSSSTPTKVPFILLRNQSTPLLDEDQQKYSSRNVPIHIQPVQLGLSVLRTQHKRLPHTVRTCKSKSKEKYRQSITEKFFADNCARQDRKEKRGGLCKLQLTYFGAISAAHLLALGHNSP